VRVLKPLARIEHAEALAGTARWTLERLLDRDLDAGEAGALELERHRSEHLTLDHTRGSGQDAAKREGRGCDAPGTRVTRLDSETGQKQAGGCRAEWRSYEHDKSSYTAIGRVARDPTCDGFDQRARRSIPLLLRDFRECDRAARA
jgi:hypothetical protein